MNKLFIVGQEKCIWTWYKSIANKNIIIYVYLSYDGDRLKSVVKIFVFKRIYE
jgi:hypothetical protein